MKYAFAGNRDIAVNVLKFIVSKGYKPELLMITDEKSIDLNSLINISGLPKSRIFKGPPKNNGVFKYLSKLDLDYIFGIHYPYIISNEILKIPKYGFLNLHPAYLPYNRGWHTPSWAILDKTPIGATLHLMSSKLDMGDIIHRKQIKISTCDTANSLYIKLKKLELEVFKDSFDQILEKEFKTTPQSENEGTSHKKMDLYAMETSKLFLNNEYKLDFLIDKLRALTTNDISEACYFEKDSKKYRIQIKIFEDNDQN